MLREHEEFQAHEYRIAEATKLLRLFREANNRDARSVDELERWAESAELETPIKPDPQDYDAAKNRPNDLDWLLGEGAQ